MSAAATTATLIFAAVVLVVCPVCTVCQFVNDCVTDGRVVYGSTGHIWALNPGFARATLDGDRSDAPCKTGSPDPR